MRADGRGIEAYDLPHRVAAYDADMALMHPNRADMVDAALDFLPLPAEAAPSAIDLGCGTGYFTARFLRRFPSGSVIAVDGAATMIDLARARLGPSAAAVQFFVGDFRDLAGLGLVGDVDAVFSSYALHHLSRREKQAVVSQAATLLRPGGWFLNADLVVASSPLLESRIQDLRVAGIVARAAAPTDTGGAIDARFRDATTTRAFLDEMEAEEGDKPLTLDEDLGILRLAGLHDVAVLWLEHREAVICGRRPA